MLIVLGSRRAGEVVNAFALFFKRLLCALIGSDVVIRHQRCR